MESINRTVSGIMSGKLKNIIRFSLVGVLNTLVDFLAFTVFYRITGIGGISQAAGYCFGVVNSFIFNRRWTFEDKSSNRNTAVEIIKFAAVNAVSLSLTLIVMNSLTKKFNINVYMVKIIVTAIAQVTNYLGYRFWVFPLKK